tara:strand:+ start:58 stop:771 length:714 start_codon:yes stop_codon:yes gene_type:complete
MKKIYWILVFLFISNISYAVDGNVGITIFVVTFYITAAIAIIISGFTFITGLMIAAPVLLVSSTYYTGKSVVVSNTDQKLYDVELCQAAKDLRLTNNKVYIADSGSLKHVTFYDKVEKLEPFFKPKDKTNTSSQYMCLDFDSVCKNRLSSNYKTVEGTWEPIRAFNANGYSYMQFKQDLGDGKYQTATANFNEVVKYLNYEGFYVFNRIPYDFDVQDLCPILRRVAIHKLKAVKELS